MPETVLKGITWGHSRGLVPLQAAAQRFHEVHPNITVQWYTRSLQQFADQPIEQLAEVYDLLVIDHPFVGTAAAGRCLLALDEFLSAGYLKELEANSVGLSYKSYSYQQHQWALPIDAAAPAASYRRDLLARANLAVPETWEQVLKLAQLGKVAVPAVPVDVLMNFYTFCLAYGDSLFQTTTEVVAPDNGRAALKTMRSLYQWIDRSFFKKNPIAVAELMTGTDDFWYCPLAYGYSNYSRPGFADNILSYSDIVRLNHTKLQTVLGGTGLAVSASSAVREEALAFAGFVASPGFQTHGYTRCEGQPAYLGAWNLDFNNRLTGGFFEALLPVMENAYLRPRYHGYLKFQDEAGYYVQEYLLGRATDESTVLEKLNHLYKNSIVSDQITKEAPCYCPFVE